MDTPARIAIIGAGPIGLEAALYGRFLGYDVDVYERGTVANYVRQWGHVRLFTPFSMNASPLGISALSAQIEDWQPPASDALLTGREFFDHYLLPLSQSDLVVDGVHERTEVVAISRGGLLKTELVGDEARAEHDFRLLVRDESGKERVATADVVFDCSGTFGSPNWAGHGGIPAVGEQTSAARITRHLPDVLGRDRAKYAGKTTLLVGAGYSAATVATGLATLIAEAPGTRAIWIARRPDEDPIAAIEDDRLPERARIAAQANEIAVSSLLTFWPGTSIDAINSAATGLSIVLTGRHAGTVEIDEMIACVGYQPNDQIYRELQVHQCYGSGAPMKLAVQLAAHGSGDCLDRPATGPATLVNPEPDFYILGAKSYGRDSRFLLAEGLKQVRDVFTILGDRAELDLYRAVGKLEPSTTERSS